MTNISISELPSTNNLKNNDLLLVSKKDNSGLTYTSCRATYDNLVKPAVVYKNPANSFVYACNHSSYTDNMTLYQTLPSGDNNFGYSSLLEIKSDYVTVDGYFLIKYDGTMSSVPNYGPVFQICLVDANVSTNRRIIYRSQFFPSSYEGDTFIDGTGGKGAYFWMPPVTVAKQDNVYLCVLTCNISTTSRIQVNQNW